MATFIKTFAPFAPRRLRRRLAGCGFDAAARFVRRPAAANACLTWVWRRDDAGALVGHWHRSDAASAAAPCAACAEAA